MSQLFVSIDVDFTETSFQCASESVTHPRQRVNLQVKQCLMILNPLFAMEETSSRHYYCSSNITITRDIQYKLDYTVIVQHVSKYFSAERW